MEKLKIGFGHGGYIVTFGLELLTIEAIQKAFPGAKPIKRVTVGYKNVDTTLEPYRKPITKYVLPLLTGLTEEQLREIKEITIYSSMRDTTLLTITQPQPHVEQV